MDRPQLTDTDFNDAILVLQAEIARRANETGVPAFVSRDEIFDVVGPKGMYGLWGDLQKGMDCDVEDRLFEVAANCIFAAASVTKNCVEC